MSSTAEKAIALIKQLNAENPLPVIEIKASKAAEPLPVTVSKFGGSAVSARWGGGTHRLRWEPNGHDRAD